MPSSTKDIKNPVAHCLCLNFLAVLVVARGLLWLMSDDPSFADVWFYLYRGWEILTWLYLPAVVITTALYIVAKLIEAKRDSAEPQ